MNKQTNYYKPRVANLLSLKSVSVAILPLTFALQMILPQSVMAQDVCTDVPASVTINGVTQTYKNFRITCTGSFNADDVKEFESTAGYESNSSEATIDFTSATLFGNLDIENNNSVMNIGNAVRIRNGIQFGGGASAMNTINITNGTGENQYFQIDGIVEDVTTLNKQGKGYARFVGGVNFNGSDQKLNLKDGLLVVVGDIDLSAGTVTIYEPGKLAFEIGENGETGTISANTVRFLNSDSSNHAVYVQWNNELDSDAVTTANEGLSNVQLLSVTTVEHGSEGTSGTELPKLAVKSVNTDGENNVGSIDPSVGTVAWGNNADNTDDDAAAINMIGALSNLTATLNVPVTPVSNTDDDDNNGAILGLGLVAVLIALYWGDGSSGSGFADAYSFGIPQSAYIASVDERSMLTIRETGNRPYQVWIRTGMQDTIQSDGVKGAGVSGTEVGLSLYRSDEFYIEASSAQDISAQVSSLNQAAQGEVYSLSSGWQNERYFAGVKLSYGEFDTDAVIHNPIINSALISESEVRHTQAQFTAGTRWSAGHLQFTPSASVQAGTFDYSAHQAKGAVLNAEIPAYSQDYSALRLGLKISASEWLNFSEDLKWKPHLQLDQIHTNSGNGNDVTLRQMDRLGILSFNSAANVQAMPEVVNAVSLGTSMKSSKSSQAEWKFGYAGLEADDEYYHAAVAAYQLRF